MSYKLFVFLGVLLANFWFWKIFPSNFVLGLLLLVTSILVYVSYIRKPYYVLLAIFFCLLLIFQYKTTSIKSLTALTKQEEVIQIQRLKEYPPTHITLGSKTLWIPAAHLLEERPETIMVYHAINNISEVLDLNLYFFANHPRERVGYKEFDKFIYILLPFFLYGTYLLFQRNKWLTFFAFCLPFFIFALIGNANPYGPFSLFPIMVCAIVLGLKQSFYYAKKSKYLRHVAPVFLGVYILVLIQAFFYAIN